MNFGDKLKAVREDRNMTQDELATLLGTSKQVISRYETGQRIPKITVAIEYAEKLNIPAIYFTDNKISSIDEAFASAGKSSFYCSKQEQSFLKKYRRLPPNGKQAVINMIDAMLSPQSVQTEDTEDTGPIIREVYRIAKSDDDHGPTIEKRDIRKFRDAPKVTREEDL